MQSRFFKTVEGKLIMNLAVQTQTMLTSHSSAQDLVQTNTNEHKTKPPRAQATRLNLN